MQTIVETPDLRIRYSEGSTDVLFVSFTGVLHGLGGIAIDEFAGSARAHHCLFVSDMKRTWYNGDGIAASICEQVAEKKRELNIRKVITIGNSMGGFGAILFARLLGASTAIAFSPQFSFDRRVVPGEHRWNEYRDAIPTWRFPTALPYASKTNYFIFFGTDPLEAQHAALFPKAPNVAFFSVAGGHTVAQAIKEAGHLARVIAICKSWPMVLARTMVTRRLMQMHSV